VFDGRLPINLLADGTTGDLVVWSNLGDLSAEHVEPVCGR
jgi:hypothetical protein